MKEWEEEWEEDEAEELTESESEKEAIIKEKKAEEEESYEAFEEFADEDNSVLPPEKLNVSTQENKRFYTPKISFYFAKDLIKTSSLPTLKNLSQELDKYPEAPLIVQGFIRGPNWLKTFIPILKSLSRARANSILRHLIVNEKIKQINVTAIGEGDSFPALEGHPPEEPILIIKVK